jgi:hypothetical protein
MANNLKLALTAARQSDYTASTISAAATKKSYLKADAFITRDKSVVWRGRKYFAPGSII